MGKNSASVEKETDCTKHNKLTILIPCYNEQESLPSLFERLESLVAGEPCVDEEPIDYTLLFVDDGSKDATRELIRDFAKSREYVSYIFLSRNFGKEHAMMAGIDAANGDGLVIIDADLQDPPELIPDMVKLWRSGYEDVYARRRSRRGEGWMKKITSRWYYMVLQRCTNVSIQRDTGDFRLLDRKCVDALKHMRESERNSKALFSWIGFKKIEFLYDRDPRVAGHTKWNYVKLIGLALDGIMSFTIAPLRIATYCGALISVAAIIYAIYTFTHTLIFGIDVPGYASLLIIMLVLGGIELLSLGIIGEYLGRVFMQTKERPSYLIEEEHLNKE